MHLSKKLTSLVFCGSISLSFVAPHNPSLPRSLKDNETIKSQISKCTSTNITRGWDLGDLGFRCLEKQGPNYMILSMVFDQQYKSFGPPTFQIPDVYEAATISSEEMSLKSNATPDGRLSGNDRSPYWDERFPATNWTSGSSIIYFEGPPCKGEWDYDEDEKRPYMEPARYKDIAASLRLLQNMMRNTHRNDTNGVSWGQVIFVPKETPHYKIRDEELVVGSLMLQNSGGKPEYRRWTYQRNLEYVCDHGRTLVNPVAVS